MLYAIQQAEREERKLLINRKSMRSENERKTLIKKESSEKEVEGRRRTSVGRG